MQSDVSILTCAAQSAPQLATHFMRGLKKESGHVPNGVLDGSPDIKSVFLSHLSTKSNGFHLSSSYNQPEPQKIPLDSVDTLLRNKSYEEPSSNSDNDLNELLQFVSERSMFCDEKPPVDSSNSFWLSNPSPPLPSASMLKDEEPVKPTKLPAVDQIMKFHPRDPPSSESVLYSMPLSTSLDKSSSFDQLGFSSPVVASALSVLTPSSPEIPSPLGCKPVQTSGQLLQSKSDEPTSQINLPYSMPQNRNLRLIKEPESSPQKSQPRFILPNTSRPSVELPIAKQTLFVPINNQSGIESTGGGSFLFLPLAVAAALQQQKQQQSNAVLTSIPTGTTQFLLIHTTPTAGTVKTTTANTTPVGIITPAKANVGISLLATQPAPPPQPPPVLIETVSNSSNNIPHKPLPASNSTTASSVLRPTPPVISIGAGSLKPALAPALLPSTSLLTKPRLRTPGEESISSIITSPAATSTPATSANLRRRHQCPYCTKSCERKDNLQAHIRTHTGERPFPCRFCPKAFPQKDHLRAHIRTHTGEKPYRCPQCSKAFAQLGNLHRHVKTHRQ
ncbi:hypothetical protein Aperf_G00000026013 [Anoplocephala perfoliata]